MNPNVLFLAGMACAILASIAWIFYRLYKAADHRAAELKRALEDTQDELKQLERQASVYAEEKKKNEQKLNEAASHSRAGFDASVELMQKLGEGRTSRND